MVRMVARHSLSSIGSVLLVALAAVAQSPATGRLTGTVTDPSGEVIPGAVILAKNAQTGGAGATATVDATLQIGLADTVVVTAAKLEEEVVNAPATATVLSKQTIRDSPPQNVAQQRTIIEQRTADQDQAYLMAKGDAQFNQGNFEEALGTYQQALAQNPNFWFIHHRVGQCHYYLGRFDQAIAAFQMSNSLEDRGANDSWLGWSYLKKNEYTVAIAFFEKSNRKDPSFARPNYEGLGAAYYWLGKYDEAIAYSTKALEYAGTEAEKSQIKYDLAFTCAAKGDYQRASDLLGKRTIIGIWLKKGGRGFLVDLIHKNGPADLAGIRAGDEIVEFEGRPLQDVSIREFNNEMIGNSVFGSVVRLKVLQDEKYLDRSVVVGVSPDLPTLAREASQAEPSPPSPATPSPGGETFPAKNDYPAAASTAKPSLVIQLLEITPGIVAPGNKFDLIVEFSVTDPVVMKKDIAVQFSYVIYEGDKVLFESEAATIESKNGISMTRTEHLIAAKQKGIYRMRVSMKYGSLSAEASKEFRIE